MNPSLEIKTSKCRGRPPLGRSRSTPCDGSDGSSAEMKELFTDPALRSRDSELRPQDPALRPPSSNSGRKSNPLVPDLHVEDPVFSTAGNHLMTRRITIAGGFLDIALFTANCEQLKFVLELGKFHIYYNHVLGLLITSLLLQLLVGFTMFLLGCQVVQKASDETYSNFLNHTTMGLVALITIINIFIGTFGPKGTVMARCLGAFAYPNTSGPIWTAYLNATKNFMAGAP